MTVIAILESVGEHSGTMVPLLSWVEPTYLCRRARPGPFPYAHTRLNNERPWSPRTHSERCEASGKQL